ncbi:MAG: hypothetical protein A4E57_01721 [Syntrophorhabdaceae bacterium PtaU1.Bin034]|nr:MAG: hypothetical protein A4E57_01721 [Syntrophorhabdaceae bacterium PtaU1.Bin034]
MRYDTKAEKASGVKITVLFLVLFLVTVVFHGHAADIGKTGGRVPGIGAWPRGADGWVWEGSSLSYNRRTVFNYIDGAAEVYLAYRMKGVTVTSYTKPDAGPVRAEVWEMGSAQDAFGVFSYERQDPSAGIGQGSEFDGGLLRFWKGRFFVTVSAEEPDKTSDLAVLALGRQLAASIRQTGRPPELLDLLPSEPSAPDLEHARFLRSHVLLNQRLFISNRNILQLGNNTEAVLVPYPGIEAKAFLLLVRYPSSKRAEAAYRSFGAEFGGARAAESAETRKVKSAKAARRGRYLAAALNVPDKEVADKLLAATLRKMKESSP